MMDAACRSGSRTCVWFRLALLAAAAAGPAAARAQSAGGLADVEQRARPELDPIGARVGSFMILPRIDLSATGDDNILGTAGDRISDVFLTAKASARAVSLWNRHRLILDGFVGTDRYLSRGSESSGFFGGSASGVLDLSRRTGLHATLGLERRAEDHLDVNSIRYSIEPIRYTQLTGSVGVTQEMARITASANAGVQRLGFSNGITVDGASIDQHYRDVTIATGSGRLLYHLDAGPAAVLSVIANRIDYAKAPGVIDRDSAGVRIEGGVNADLTSLLYGEVRAGYISQRNRDPRLPDVGGASFFVSLLYLPTPLTSVRVTADRSVEPTSSPSSAANLRTQGAIDVQHELLRQLVLKVQLRIASISPRGPFDALAEYDGSFSAVYRLNRRYRVTATYRHFARSSSDSGDIVADRLTFGVAATF